MEQLQIMGIFGTGRSGSSWLGSIADSHPQVAYRFEPFHRLRKYPKIHKARQLLQSPQLTDADLEQVYQLLLASHPKTERPPFFAKDYFTWGKTWMRLPARVLKPVHPLFRWMYTPNNRPALIFKEVTLEKVMTNLLAKTSMKIVYLVRHPCAVVNSTLSGMKKGYMPEQRHHILDQLLARHDPKLAEKYVSQFAQMGALEKETLLWRMDVEQGIAAAKDNSNALIIFYEELCVNPQAIAQQMFKHFGLDFSAQTAEYIKLFLGELAEKKVSYKEYGVKNYFSVFQNPAQIKDKWKQQLPANAQQQILGLLEESEAFQYCKDLGKW